MEKFTLINKDRSGIKVFETFEDSSKSFSIINKILIYKGFLISDQVSQSWKALFEFIEKTKKPKAINFEIFK